MTAGKHLGLWDLCLPEQAAINKKNSASKNVAAWLTLEQRSTPTWNTEALQHLTQLETWTRSLGREIAKYLFSRPNSTVDCWNSHPRASCTTR